MPKDNLETSKPCHLTTNWIPSDKSYHELMQGDKNIKYDNSFAREKNDKDNSPSKRKKNSIAYYKALQTQRKCSPHKTMRLCGLRKSFVAQNDNHITCSVSSKGVTVKGMAFCQSPFCVTCMGYQRTQRRKKIEKGLQQARRHGYSAYFVTLTIERTNDIQKQVKDLFYGWKLLQDRLSYRMKKQGVNVFMVRNLDITFKPDCHAIYHTHLHCIIILDDEMEAFTDRKTKQDIRNFPEFLKTSWVNIQRKRDIKCSLQGQHIEKVEDDKKLSRYVSKFEGLAMELSHFQHKTGKNNKLCKTSIGYMELLGFVHKRDKKCFQIYRDFLKAMHGCRTVSFSRNWYTVNEEKEVIEVLLLPFAEREEEKEEPKTHEIYVSNEWFVYLKSTWDKFILSLQLAHIKGFLLSIEHMLELKPNYHDIDLLYNFFHLSKL